MFYQVDAAKVPVTTMVSNRRLYELGKFVNELLSLQLKLEGIQLEGIQLEGIQLEGIHLPLALASGNEKRKKFSRL